MNCSMDRDNIPLEDITVEVEEEVVEANKVETALGKRREVLRKSNYYYKTKIWFHVDIKA